MSAESPAPLPRPPALRLVRAAASPGKPPRPPLGVKAWSEEAGALAVLPELPKGWPGSGMGDVEVIARQVPPASELASGTLVLVLGEADADGLMPRWLAPRARIARAVRGSALLARGYVRIGGGTDAGHDLAWGYAP